MFWKRLFEGPMGKLLVAAMVALLIAAASYAAFHAIQTTHLQTIQIPALVQAASDQTIQTTLQTANGQATIQTTYNQAMLVKNRKASYEDGKIHSLTIKNHAGPDAVQCGFNASVNNVFLFTEDQLGPCTASALLSFVETLEKFEEFKNKVGQNAINVFKSVVVPIMTGL